MGATRDGLGNQTGTSPDRYTEYPVSQKVGLCNRPSSGSTFLETTEFFSCKLYLLSTVKLFTMALWAAINYFCSVYPQATRSSAVGSRIRSYATPQRRSPQRFSSGSHQMTKAPFEVNFTNLASWGCWGISITITKSPTFLLLFFPFDSKRILFKYYPLLYQKSSPKSNYRIQNNNEV